MSNYWDKYDEDEEELTPSQQARQKNKQTDNYWDKYNNEFDKYDSPDSSIENIKIEEDEIEPENDTLVKKNKGGGGGSWGDEGISKEKGFISKLWASIKGKKPEATEEEFEATEDLSSSLFNLDNPEDLKQTTDIAFTNLKSQRDSNYIEVTRILEDISWLKDSKELSKEENERLLNYFKQTTYLDEETQYVVKGDRVFMRTGVGGVSLTEMDLQKLIPNMEESLNKSLVKLDINRRLTDEFTEKISTNKGLFTILADQFKSGELEPFKPDAVNIKDKKNVTSAIEKFKEGVSLQELSLQEKMAITDLMNEQMEASIDRGFWSEVVGSVIPSTRMGIEFGLGSLLAGAVGGGGGNEIVSGLKSIVGKNVVGSSSGSKSRSADLQSLGLQLQETDEGEVFFNLSHGAMGETEANKKAFFSQGVQDAIEVMLGGILGSIFGGVTGKVGGAIDDTVTSALAGTKGGDIALKVIKVVGGSFDEVFSNNSQMGYYLKKLGRNKWTDELKEEVAGSIADYVIEGEDLDLSSPDFWKNTIASTLLLSGLFGTSNLANDLVDVKERKRFMDTIKKNTTSLNGFDIDDKGDLVDIDTDKKIKTPEAFKEALTEKVISEKENDLKTIIEEDIAKVETQEPTTSYKAEEDLDTEGLSDTEQRAIADTLKKLQADVDLGARKKLVTETEEGGTDRNISVEGAVIPEFIPEELRDRKIIQQAMDAIYEQKVPQEGTKAWQVYQAILEESQSKVEEYEKEVVLNTFIGKDIAKEAQDLGSDQGGLSDYSLDKIRKEDYKTETISIAELRKLDPDLDKYIKETEEVRDFEGEANKMNPIVSSTGEVQDGYNRIHQAVLNGEREITILRGIKEEKEKKAEKSKASKSVEKDKIELEELSEKANQAKEEFEGKNPMDLWKVVTADYLSEKDQQRLQELGGLIETGEFLTRGIETQKDLIEIVRVKRELRKLEVEFDKDASLQELSSLLEKQDSLDYPDLPFRTNEYGKQVLDDKKLDNATLDELKTESRRLFGTENVEILSQILTSERQKALGKYFNRWISIRSGVSKGSTFYHEAVHEALDIFLTPKEKALLLKEVRTKIGDDVLKKEWNRKTTAEKYDLLTYRNVAMKTYSTGLKVAQQGWTGVQNITKKDGLTQSDKEYLIDLSNSVGVDSNKLFSSVVQETNLDTNEKKVFLVEGIENGVHAINLIDEGMGHQAQLGNLSYGVSAITPSMIKFLQNPYLNVEVFDPSKLPYSFDVSDASSEREYRIQFGITKDGKGKARFRGTSTNEDIDTMAEEWLAENIISYINNEPTTFIGKIKQMVDTFIDRWFRTMDDIDNVKGFYKALLSGRLLERQSKIEKNTARAYEKYLNFISKRGIRTNVMYRVKSSYGNKEVLLREASEFYTKEEWISHFRGSATQYNKYTPELRKHGTTEESVRISELGVDPELDLVIYRGIDDFTDKIKDPKIIDGDYVTTDFDSANSYSGKKVLEKEIKAKDLIVEFESDFDSKEPFYLGSEFIYSDSKNEVIKYTDEELGEIWEETQRDPVKYRIENIEQDISVKLPELLSMANDLGVNVKLQKKFRKLGKVGEFRPTGETDSRIKLLRSLFAPQGDMVLNVKGEEEQMDETDEQRRERVAQIEHVLAHEIGHLFDWYGGEGNMIQKRGNILGRIANLKRFMEGEFRDLSNKDIRKELKTLTQVWSPFDEATATKKYKSYRYRSEELYAEAISVLLNKPELLKETAPQFYQGFVEYLSRKPEVKKELFTIYDMIKESNQVSNRVENMKKAQYEAQGKRMTIVEEEEAYKKQKKWQNVVTKLKMGFQDQYAPYLDRLRKAWKEGGIEFSKLEEAEQLMGDLALKGNDGVKYTQDIQEQFFVPISEAGIETETVGEILVLERNLGDRIDLANPHGLIYDYAQETYDLIKSQLTPVQWTLLQDRLSWWRDYNFDLVKKGYEAGVYSKKFFDEIATVNKNTYTPFAVVNYIEDNYITAGIIQATGTTKGVENPLTTQMLKSISLMRLTARNNAKQDIVKTFLESFSEEVTKAVPQKDGEGRTVGFKRNPKLERKGLVQLELLEDGKRTAYYMDKYIVSMFDSNLGGVGWDIARTVTLPIRMINRIFKPAVTVMKASFQFYSNPIKDYTRTLTNLTALSGMFDDSNVVSRTRKVSKAFKKEWVKNLKRSWDYAGGDIDSVMQKLRDMYVLSSNVKYEDIDLGTEKFSFDPVKNRVVYKGGINWLESIRDFGAKIPLIKSTLVPMYDLYMRAGATLEVNSKVAGFQYLTEQIGDKKAAFYTRKYVGTPDYMQKGKFTPLTNDLMVFSNVGIQAVTADSELATRPKTASGYWMSTVITKVLPKLLMFLGSQILKVPIPDPDDPEKTIMVNPYDYLSEYYKGMYMAFPIGYDKESENFVFVKVPVDEVGGVVGDLVWKMATYLSGEGMKIEQLASAFAGLIPFTTGDNPLLSISRDWLQYAQGRNPYDDFRGRLAINQTKWNEGGSVRLGEMIKWTTNELGVTNFSTYDKSMDTTFEKIMNLPLLERMFEVTDYGKQEREEWEKAKGKEEKNKNLDGLIEDFYAEPSDEKLLTKIDEYILIEKGEEPEEGWKGDEKADATRLRQEFKRNVLENSGNKAYRTISKANLPNEDKEDILNVQKKAMSKEEFNDYLTQLVRYEVVKGEFLAEYLNKKGTSDQQVYQIATQSIGVLPADSSNTLFWELRKYDLMNNSILRQIYDEGYISPSGYKKYKALNSKVYEERYGDTKKSSTSEKLFN